jgi:hypothetical protein
VLPKASPQEINELAQDPVKANEAVNKMVMGTVHNKVKVTCDDIERKYAAILKLQQSVEDIYDMQMELAGMI